MTANLRQHRVNDPVEVVAILRPLEQYDPLKLNRRSPVMGDRGNILQISGSPENPRYLVTCTEPDSSHIWTANLGAAEFRLLLPRHGMVALAFAHALASGLFHAAHLMLTPASRIDFPPFRLQSEYNGMCASEAGLAEDVQLLSVSHEWPGKLADDVGSAYVGICGSDPEGNTWNEGVDVVVANTNGGLLIREILWGRP